MRVESLQVFLLFELKGKVARLWIKVRLGCDFVVVVRLVDQLVCLRLFEVLHKIAVRIFNLDFLSAGKRLKYKVALDCRIAKVHDLDSVRAGLQLREVDHPI